MFHRLSTTALASSLLAASAVCATSDLSTPIDDVQVDQSINLAYDQFGAGQLGPDNLQAVGATVLGWCDGPLVPPLRGVQPTGTGQSQGGSDLDSAGEPEQIGKPEPMGEPEPVGPTTRERLRQAVENLIERASSGYMLKQDIYALELAVLDARVDRAMGWLREQASERGASRQQYEAVRDAWMARARVASPEMPEHEHYRSRFSEVLDGMISGAISYEQGEKQLRLADLEQRLRQASRLLRQQGQQRPVTQEQVSSFSTMLIQRSHQRAQVAQGI